MSLHNFKIQRLTDRIGFFHFSFFRHLQTQADPARASHVLTLLLPLLSQITDQTLILVVDAIESSLKTAATSLDHNAATLLNQALLECWKDKAQGELTLH